MNKENPFRKRAQHTVHTVPTVHRSELTGGCAWTVRLGHRPQPSFRRPPTVQLSLDVATRANVGRDTASGSDLDGQNRYFLMQQEVTAMGTVTPHV